MAVARTGGASSILSSSTAVSGITLLFALPASTNYLLASFSIYVSGVTVTSCTWKPDPGDASKDQAMTFLGFRGTGTGRCEMWGLANPTASVAGALVDHVISAASKRLLGLQSFSGVGSIGTPVGNDSASATTVTATVTSEVGGMVSDVMFAQNSTTSRTAAGGQTERWDINTTGGTNNLGGGGSDKAGAASVGMQWTLGTAARIVVLAVPVNASGTLPISRSGTGSLSQSQSLSSTGSKGGKGTGSLSQSGSMTATASKGGRGAGNLSQTAVLTALGAGYTGPALSGAGSISQPWSLAATGRKAGRGTGSHVQGYVMSVAGRIVFPGTVLADAVAIYVGEVPAVAVYAGTVRDWPP